jgi:hypothetical protein
MVASAALHPFRPSFPLLRLSIFNYLAQLSQLNSLNSTLSAQLNSLNSTFSKQLSLLGTLNSTLTINTLNSALLI